jgi:hypothetical protein
MNEAKDKLKNEDLYKDFLRGIIKIRKSNLSISLTPKRVTAPFGKESYCENILYHPPYGCPFLNGDECEWCGTQKVSKMSDCPMEHVVFNQKFY